MSRKRVCSGRIYSTVSIPSISNDEETRTTRLEADDDASHVMSDRRCIWPIRACRCAFADPIKSSLRSLVNLQAYFFTSIIGLFPLHFLRSLNARSVIPLQEILHEKAQLTDSSSGDTAKFVSIYHLCCYHVSIERHFFEEKNRLISLYQRLNAEMAEWRNDLHIATCEIYVLISSSVSLIEHSASLLGRIDLTFDSRSSWFLIW